MLIVYLRNILKIENKVENHVYKASGGVPVDTTLPPVLSLVGFMYRYQVLQVQLGNYKNILTFMTYSSDFVFFNVDERFLKSKEHDFDWKPL